MDRVCLVNVHKADWGKSSIYAPIDSEIEPTDNTLQESSARGSVRSPTKRNSKNERLSALLEDVGSEHDGERLKDEQSPEQFGIDLHELDLESNANTNLPNFQAFLFATVLEDTLTESRILGECNNEMRVTKVYSDMRLLQALKFGVEQTVITDELEGINPYDLNKHEYKLNKLDSDRKFVGDLFLKMYVDLSTRGSFEALSDCVHNTAEKDRQFVELIEEEARNKIKAKMLAKQLRQQRNNCKRIQYDSDVHIDTLKTAIEDADLIFEIRNRYVGNWQSARAECHDLIIAQKESGETNSIEYYKRRTDHEQRVHSEAELLTNIIINETLQSVDDWMNKYEVDMEAIDLKIQVKRLEWQAMYDKRVYLEEKYARHDREMKAWIAFKEKRAKERLYNETMTNSAIIVQAWWRGLLVRKELGPYRKKKKKKEKKK